MKINCTLNSNYLSNCGNEIPKKEGKIQSRNEFILTAAKIAGSLAVVFTAGYVLWNFSSQNPTPPPDGKNDANPFPSKEKFEMMARMEANRKAFATNLPNTTIKELEEIYEGAACERKPSLDSVVCKKNGQVVATVSFKDFPHVSRNQYLKDALANCGEPNSESNPLRDIEWLETKMKNAKNSSDSMGYIMEHFMCGGEKTERFEKLLDSTVKKYGKLF